MLTQTLKSLRDLSATNFVENDARPMRLKQSFYANFAKHYHRQPVGDRFATGLRPVGEQSPSACYFIADCIICTFSVKSV